MRIADAQPLDERHDFHARAELTLLRLDAQNPGVRALQCVKHPLRRAGQRPRRDAFNQDALPGRAGVVERRRDARSDLAARFIGDERDALPGLDRQADVDRVSGAGHEVGRRGPEQRFSHRSYCTFPSAGRFP